MGEQAKYCNLLFIWLIEVLRFNGKFRLAGTVINLTHK